MIATTPNLSELLDKRPFEFPQGLNIDSKLPSGSNLYSRERLYRLYVPSGYDPSKPSALLVVLHGCLQTNEDIQQITGFEALADREHSSFCIPMSPAT